jgi:hypothetical protein
MSIVLGGSRKIDRLPSEIQDLLAAMMNDQETFIVGDAIGSDLAFQKFFLNSKYKAVTVYSSAGYVRNNVGNWPDQLIDSGLKSKSNATHAIKDRKMVEIAKLGIMIWDSESAGTLSNVIDLVEQEKECYLWLAAESELSRFDNLNSLEKFLKNYPDQTEEAKKRLNRFRKRALKSAQTDEQTLF